MLPFVLTGCMTHDLLTRAKSDSSYTEEVASILISEDEKKLVFIGEDYHYIFDAPMELTNSLRSTFRKSLYAKYKHFRVNLNQ